MGEMADMALDCAFEEEADADEYVQGDMSMEDAYEHGFLDSTGAEVNMEDAWERSPIPTPEALDQQLQVAELQLQVTSQSSSSMSVSKAIRIYEAIRICKEAGLTVININKEAVKNLNKECPTCNCCGEEMTTRIGKFGKFYFCTCPDQVTVSDKYWQSIKR